MPPSTSHSPRGRTLRERLWRDFQAAEQFQQSLKPREALARAQQTLRMHAREAAAHPEAQQMVELIRQRAPHYRRSITRKTERTLQREARFRARELAQITPPHTPIERPSH